jgi:hypothetical protein
VPLSSYLAHGRDGAGSDTRSSFALGDCPRTIGHTLRRRVTDMCRSGTDATEAERSPAGNIDVAGLGIETDGVVLTKGEGRPLNVDLPHCVRLGAVTPPMGKGQVSE